MSTRPEHGHVGVQELLPLLGVSRARIYQLINNDPTFPAPVADLKAGKVWHTADIEAWAAHRRAPGRPTAPPQRPPSSTASTETGFRFPGE